MMPGTLPVNSAPSCVEVTLSGCTPLPSMRMSPRTGALPGPEAHAPRNRPAAASTLAFMAPASFTIPGGKYRTDTSSELATESGSGGGVHSRSHDCNDRCHQPESAASFEFLHLQCLHIGESDLDTGAGVRLVQVESGECLRIGSSDLQPADLARLERDTDLVSRTQGRSLVCLQVVERNVVGGGATGQHQADTQQGYDCSLQ